MLRRQDPLIDLMKWPNQLDFGSKKLQYREQSWFQSFAAGNVASFRSLDLEFVLRIFGHFWNSLTASRWRAVELHVSSSKRDITGGE